WSGVTRHPAAHPLLRPPRRAHLNPLLAGWTITSTRVPVLHEVSPWPDDGEAPETAITTPNEMALFLHRLIQGDLLHDSVRTELDRWLLQPEELDPVVMSLPAQADVFIKLGEFED